MCSELVYKIFFVLIHILENIFNRAHVTEKMENIFNRAHVTEKSDIYKYVPRTT